MILGYLDLYFGCLAIICSQLIEKTPGPSNRYGDLVPDTWYLRHRAPGNLYFNVWTYVFNLWTYILMSGLTFLCLDLCF